MSIIERVPKLNIRQKHLIKVFSFALDVPFNENSISSAEDLYKKFESSKPIGAIQSLSITTDRDLKEWRELNYDTLGRVMEVYPSLPEFKINVSKIALYKEHLLDAFGAVKKDVFAGSKEDNALKASFNIYNQISPINICVDILSPSNNSYSDSKNVFVMIYDCWFDKSEIEFEIGADDIRIVQDAELTCAGLLTYNKK